MRAETWLAEIADADWPSSSELPVALLAAAGALVHIGEPPQRPPRLRLRTERGRWLEIHATRIHGPDVRQTAIILEQAQPTTLTSLILVAHAVTGAQARVVALVLRGYSTQQIVNRLHISSHTAQEHLKAVFDKFGVRSRRELAAALLMPPRASDRHDPDPY